MVKLLSVEKILCCPAAKLTLDTGALSVVICHRGCVYIIIILPDLKVIPAIQIYGVWGE